MKRRILGSMIISLVVLAAIGLFTSSRHMKVSGQAQSSRGWRVWVRTSPCSGRFDWLSVAKDFPPPQGGGLSTYVPYETLIAVPPRPEPACTDSTEQGCTFAEAEALREKLRGNSKFLSFCCHDYSVWTKDATKETDVFLVRVGTPGLGWSFVKGDLCCEEAEAIAGKPGACSRGGFGNINQNAGLNGKALKFYGATTPEDCQADCERNAQCQGFTFIRPGAYTPTDPKMCYLMSEATSYAPSPCCISGIKAKKQTDARPTGSTGVSNSNFGDLTGTWVMAGQEGDEYWRTTLPLQPAGKNTWKGEATNKTSVVPCSADSYLTPGFAGSVTIVVTGPGVFNLTMRGVHHCDEENPNGRPFEVRWSGTFTDSQMVIKAKPSSKGDVFTRQ